MFTGIVTHLGKITSKATESFIITADRFFVKKLEKGMSIAVNGVCLTVLETPSAQNFSVEVMPETFKRSMLETLEKNNLINLELPVTSQSLLSGHIVQGHVDGVGIIKKIKKEGNSKIVTIDVPRNFNKYIVEKAFIAVNGISLTVIDVTDAFFTVGIIPFTWEHTMLHTIKIGDQVNIEIDILAKYVEKLLRKGVVSI